MIKVILLPPKSVVLKIASGYVIWQQLNFRQATLQELLKVAIFCIDIANIDHFPSNRQHLSCGDCLEGKRGYYLTSSVLLCIIIGHIICTPI